VVKVFNFNESVARRSIIGGTAPQAVAVQLLEAKKYLQNE
jgi:argininosuccinate lyase